MKVKLIKNLKSRVLLVSVPEKEDDNLTLIGKDAVKEIFIGGEYYSLPDGKWQLLSTLRDLTDSDCEGLVGKKINCFVCGGDGKETCVNPDHGFIGYGSPLTFLGSAESRCPCCGFDPRHKIPNGGICECCNGSGVLSESDFEEKADEYGYDDEPNEKSAKESFLSALESDGVHLNGNPLSNEISAPDIEEWKETEQNVFSKETLIFIEQ